MAAAAIAVVALFESSTAETPSNGVAPPGSRRIGTGDFERQIAPILLRHCGACHNESELAGGLSLLSHDAALRGGKSGEPAIKPGDLDNSYLVTRLVSGEMPPPGKGKPLAADELAAVKQWIEAGAPWPQGRVLDLFEVTTDTRAGRDWWSLKPPDRPSLPPVKNAGWVRTPIDAFTLAKLEEHGLAPAPDADRTTLIRRAKLDLLGLPPTPQEVQEFIDDKSPDAYEKLIDRLLASPHYGERWARHWLDVARFAESNGFEMNQPRPNAWPFRDYVIEAFNADKPYTQFIIEQLAGDQVGASLGTGFLVAGPYDAVKSPDIELTRMQRLAELDDIVSTTCTAFLGLTAGCAKCHDHKFDPIAQRDYYSLQAVFAGVQHGEREIETPRSKQNRKRRDEISREIVAAEREQRNIMARGEPPAQVVADPKQLKSKRMPVHPAGNVDRFAPVNAKFVRFTVRATNNLEPCIDELEIYSPGSEPRNVALASAGAVATASGVFQDGRVSIHQLAHINDGRYGNSWSWISNEPGRGWVQIELPEPTLIDRVEWARDREGAFNDRLPTSYTIEIATEPGKWQTVATSDDRSKYDPKKKADPRKPEDLPAENEKQFRELAAKIDSLKAELAKLKPQTAYVGSFSEPGEPTFRLNRGDPMQRREEVQPAAIEAVGKPLEVPRGASEGARRMALAKWIASDANPLTARVMVNRIWHYHFGQGLMRNPSDFGFNGGRPSHPELLDWLATEFMAGGWHPKQIHRLIMLSSTYRQSHRIDPRAAEIDGANTLLWRFPMHRLEAEPIRDSILAVSGALDLTMGGVGFDVFEPNDNYVKVYNPKQMFGPADWRRAIYISKPRMQFDGTFGAFDCPDSAQPVAKRNVSTTALQALNLLNAPFMIQQAEILAKRLEQDAPGDKAAQVQRAFQLAFGRPATVDEQKAAIELENTAGLAGVCRAILNSSELIYVP